MNYLKVIPRTLWKVYFAVNFGIGLIVLYPLFYIFLSKRSWFPKALTVKRFWARWILFGSGIFVKTKNQENLLKGNKPCIYCANHASYLDIVLCYYLLPGYYTFMAKAELLRAPLFNIFFTSGMDIAVERKSVIGAHRALMIAAQGIDEGTSLFIFPEGTISANGAMKGFKNGAFKLAIDKQVDVIPITFKNNWKLLQNGGLLKSFGRPGIAYAEVHEPISTKGMTDLNIEYLKEKVFEVISKGLK